MISWSYYGEQGTVYLGGKRWVLPYKMAFLALAVVGSVFVETTRELDDLSTFGAGLMLWANMVIVLWMGYLAVRSLADYFRRLDQGEFHPHAYPPFTDVVDGTDVED
jgi:AGCS family alanine or glycine:cation symporter